MTMRRLRLPLLFATLTLVLGCAERPTFRGGGCELNSDCDEPLVCGFGRCRTECRSDVDCALGLDCFGDIESGLGFCQLSDELNCTRNSDCCDRGIECAGKIVCRAGECGQACVEDRDCVEGSVCREEEGGDSTCEPISEGLCVYNSDCALGLICDPYQRCRVECAEDRDCEFPRVCRTQLVEGVETPLCVLLDGGT